MGYTRCTGAEVGDGSPVKPLSRGDIVLVVWTRSPGYQVVVGMVVKKWGRNIRCEWTDGVGGHHIHYVARRAEGRTWARGVRGPAADALRSYMALT